MSTCGLDFGTSNTAAALGDGRVLRVDPEHVEPRLLRSVLFFPEDERQGYTGAAAIARYLEDNAGRFIQSVKSFLHSSSFRATQIKGRTWTLEELVAVLLRRVREAVGAETGGAPEAVVLGRPALFTSDSEADTLAERRLRKAAELAGFKQVQFLIEPIAAALAYEAQLKRDELVLVADFGAGTTDLTLMWLGPGRRGKADRRADVVGSSGVRIGGDKFDAEIMRHKLLHCFGAGSTYKVKGISDKRMPMPQHIMSKLLSWHEMSFIREKSTQELLEVMLDTSDRPEQVEALYDLVMDNLGYRLFRAIEAAKVKLSEAEEAAVDFEEGRVRIHERITRAEFESFCEPLLKGLEECTQGLLERCGDAAERIDAVFLTGGSSQIPAVQQLFAARFGEERMRTADAFTSVAEGLGRASAGWSG